MTSQAGRSGDRNEADEALLAAIAERRDREAFAELFRRYAVRIKALLMRARTSRDVAEEVVREVMVTVWRKAERLDAVKASAATWIYTVARNRRIDLHRREARSEPDPEDPLWRLEPQGSPERQLAGADHDAQLRAAHGRPAAGADRAAAAGILRRLQPCRDRRAARAAPRHVKSRLRLSFARLRSRLGEEFSAELVDD